MVCSDGWNYSFEIDTYSMSFYLEGKEIAYIEKGFNFETSDNVYLGFCKTKDNQHFHLEDDNLEIIKFKAMLKLKQFGWDIDNWETGGDQ